MSSTRSCPGLGEDTATGSVCAIIMTVWFTAFPLSVAVPVMMQLQFPTNEGAALLSDPTHPTLHAMDAPSARTQERFTSQSLSGRAGAEQATAPAR
jgi:hypothetical protein